MKPISIIVAIAEDNAIGRDNQMIWHLPDDLKRFKNITDGHSVIMGKNTYLSLPKRPLPRRTNIVLSHQTDLSLEGCTMAHSLEEALSVCDVEKENFIIGGDSIYRQFLPFAQKLYITRVFATFEADTFFPVIDPATWEICSSEDHPEDEKHPFPFRFLIYKRKTK